MSIWDCKIARRARDSSIMIINTMKAKPRETCLWKPLDWQHEIFGKKIPSFLVNYHEYGVIEWHYLVDYQRGKE